MSFEVAGWTDVGGVRRPIIVKHLTITKTLDLTGDRPLTRGEARKLFKWWHGGRFSAEIIKVRRNRYMVLAHKVEYIAGRFK